tara:strand:+ start:1113 stop:2837 length:1725 start_codon:yes stop_codon:yes gene_type:complete
MHRSETYIRGLVESQLRAELRKTLKKQQITLKENIESVKEAQTDILRSLPRDIQEHYNNHKNDLFVPILDEATGEETFEARNFDELLEEHYDSTTGCVNDELYEILNSSLTYETSLFQDQPLTEVDWAKRAAELEAGDETDKYDAEGRKKGLAQRGKEKVKGAIASIKGAFSEGLLIAVLKLIDKGLKIGLKISKGIPSLIIQTLVKKMVLPLIKATSQAIASARAKREEPPEQAKASSIMAKIKAAVAEKIPPIMKTIMTPFLKVSMILAKMSGAKGEDAAQRAAVMAPILFSISITLILIGAQMAFSGLFAANEAVAETAKGVSDMMSIEDTGEMVAGMCAESMVGFTLGMSAAQIITERKRLFLEGCGVVDEAGKEIRNDVMLKAMHMMMNDVNTGIKDVGQLVISTVEGGGAGVEDFSEEAVKMGKNNISKLAQTANSVVNEMKQVGGSAIVNLKSVAGSQAAASKVQDYIEAARSIVDTGGDDITDSAFGKTMDTIKTSWEVDSSLEMITKTTNAGVYEEISQVSKQTFKGFAGKGVRDTTEKAAEDLVNPYLQENQVARLRKLALIKG